MASYAKRHLKMRVVFSFGCGVVNLEAITLSLFIPIYLSQKNLSLIFLEMVVKFISDIFTVGCSVLQSTIHKSTYTR